jgi:acyl dehydratase
MSNGTVDAREPLYFDELAPGRRFTTQNHALQEAEIKTFAAQYDSQPFHVDAAAASHSVFGGLVGLGGEISWPRATRAGDVLHVESEVMSATPTRRQHHGVVTLRSRTCTERGEAVQIFTAKLLVPRRPVNDAGSSAS